MPGSAAAASAVAVVSGVHDLDGGGDALEARPPVARPSERRPTATGTVFSERRVVHRLCAAAPGGLTIRSSTAAAAVIISDSRSALERMVRVAWLVW
jgi:hypothetical protein